MKRAQTTFNKVPFLGVQVSGYDTFFSTNKGEKPKNHKSRGFFFILATKILQLIFLRQLSRAFYRSHKIETFQTRLFFGLPVFVCGTKQQKEFVFFGNRVFFLGEKRRRSKTGLFSTTNWVPIYQMIFCWVLLGNEMDLVFNDFFSAAFT